MTTVREGKLQRYETRSTKMLVKFQEHIKVFMTFLEVLEVSQNTKRRILEVLEEGLRESQQIQKDRVALHEGRK